MRKFFTAALAIATLALTGCAASGNPQWHDGSDSEKAMLEGPNTSVNFESLMRTNRNNEADHAAMALVWTTKYSAIRDAFVQEFNIMQPKEETRLEKDQRVWGEYEKHSHKYVQATRGARGNAVDAMLSETRNILDYVDVMIRVGNPYLSSLGIQESAGNLKAYRAYELWVENTWKVIGVAKDEAENIYRGVPVTTDRRNTIQTAGDGGRLPCWYWVAGPRLTGVPEGLWSEKRCETAIQAIPTIKAWYSNDLNQAYIAKRKR